MSATSTTAPAEVTYNRACEKTAASQVAMDDCADEELSELTAQLASALNSEQVTFSASGVTAAENAWVGYRDAECHLQAGQYTGGSIEPLQYTECQVALTSDRIAEIRRIMAKSEP